MKLDKLKKFMGMFGGISPPEVECPFCGALYLADGLHLCPDTQDGDVLPAADESDAEYEIRTRTAAIFVSPEIASLPH